MYDVPETYISFGKPYVVSTRSDLVIDGLSFTGDINSPEENLFKVQTLAYAVMSLLYGALHLGAWSYGFPSTVEMWMWRGSGLSMVSAPTLLVMALYGMDIPDRDERKRKGIRWVWAKVRSVVGLVVSLGGILLALVPLLVYPFARGYVLGESFASLRAVERRTYETVEWTNFIPHAG